MRDKQIKEDFEFLTVFEALARALQEVSIIKMQQVREFVLKARTFHDGLAETYRDVRNSALFDTVQAQKALAPTKKSIVVLLTANATMYGSLSDQVYAQFKAHLKEDKESDILILGKLGKDKFEKDEEVKREYKYFLLEEVDKMYTNMLKIMIDLIVYEKVILFYGSFINMYKQEPIQKVMPGNMMEELLDKSMSLEKFDKVFILEPSSEELERFFSTQIMGLLFRQSMLEFELARNAARVSTLEKSLDNTEQQKKKAIMLMNKLKRNKDGNTISKAIAFFRKGH